MWLLCAIIIVFDRVLSRVYYESLLLVAKEGLSLVDITQPSRLMLCLLVGHANLFLNPP